MGEKKPHTQRREEKGSRAQEREKQSGKKKKRHKDMQFFNALTGEAGIPDFQTLQQTHGIRIHFSKNKISLAMNCLPLPPTPQFI